jgi:hypothetical protein
MDRPKASEARRQLLQTERSRADHVEEILRASVMIEGSFVTRGRKCGKSGCRCTTGEKHYSKYVSRSVDGRTQLIYVSGVDEVDVATKTGRYRRFREARASLMKLAQQTAELVDDLQEALTEKYAARARHRPSARRQSRKGTPPTEE